MTKDLESFAAALSALGHLEEEDKVFHRRLLSMIDQVHGAVMGSAIETLIRTQGPERTKEDLCYMVDRIVRLIEAIEKTKPK